MSENKDYNIDLETENVMNEDNEDEIEFIDYDIDKVKADKRDDTLDFDKVYDGENEKTNWKAEVISWIKMIVIAVLAAFIINNFIIVNATVPTGSMENTIMPEDRLIGLRLSYMFSDPERGDIVIFKYPLNEEKNYIKRIIGLPGETVEIVEGEIFVYETNDDGTKGELIEGPLKEPYLKEEWVYLSDGITFVVPEERYLMIGDNRNGSSDARDWQIEAKNKGLDEEIIYVHKDKILGKALFKYWDGFEILE